MKIYWEEKIKPFVLKYWKHTLGALAVILVLVFAFWYGGNSSGSRGWSAGGRNESTGQYLQSTEGITLENTSQAETDSIAYTEADTEKESKTASDESTDETAFTEASAVSESMDAASDNNTSGSQSGKKDNTSQGNAAQDSNQGNGVTAAASSGQEGSQNSNQGSSQTSNQGSGQNTKPEQAAETVKQPACTISISCATILNNMDMLNKSKKDIVPADGWILKPVTVTYSEGESVFDVLQRIVQQNGIHMESSYTPMYGSIYVEGIYNLYEFDCGELSGWMYSVNGVFPNYGCSSYILKDGDVICWVYTCDLGYDVGGGYAVGE